MTFSRLSFPCSHIFGFVLVSLRIMTPLISDILVGLIVDLDLAPKNDMAKEFFDVHWLEVIELEDQRQLLDNMAWRNKHIHLRKSDPFYVYPSYCGDLFGTPEQTK